MPSPLQVHFLASQQQQHRHGLGRLTGHLLRISARCVIAKAQSVWSSNVSALRRGLTASCHANDRDTSTTNTFRAKEKVPSMSHTGGQSYGVPAKIAASEMPDVEDSPSAHRVSYQGLSQKSGCLKSTANTFKLSYCVRRTASASASDTIVKAPRIVWSEGHY